MNYNGDYCQEDKMKRLYTEDNIDELNANIERYFQEHETPGFAGLAYALGFSSRQSLWEYAGREDEISLPIKRAMLYIEADYEKSLRSQHCTGSIFALKNRGWTDKQEIEHSGEIVYIPEPLRANGK